ncbi:hypothetical protein ACFPYI_04425 [Halomarina salina]|uniref:Uncharacterized protein n=1 Tax=Halomarina salina TaxID=1872699 RepID=A0ABD5RJT9_9EURY|nr:hypothetical protein [Halomarina salina]
MEFDATRTVAVFVVLVAIGTLGLFATPMDQSTILMMVLPSLVVGGLVFLFLGVKHGEYRATR